MQMLRRTVRFYHLIQLYRRVELVGGSRRARIPQVNADRHAHDEAAHDQARDADQDDPGQVDAEDRLDVLVRRRTLRPDGLVRPVRTVVHPVAQQVLVYAELGLGTPEVGAVDFGVLDGGDNHFETVRFRAPVIGHVLECEKVRLGE